MPTMMITPERVKISKGSRIVAERWYYDDTYLTTPGENDAYLFVRHFALVETKSGKRDVRVRHSVESYADTDTMRAAIRDRVMGEVPAGFSDDRSWLPPELVGSSRSKAVR